MLTLFLGIKSFNGLAKVLILQWKLLFHCLCIFILIAPRSTLPKFSAIFSWPLCRMEPRCKAAKSAQKNWAISSMGGASLCCLGDTSQASSWWTTYSGFYWMEKSVVVQRNKLDSLNLNYISSSASLHKLRGLILNDAFTWHQINTWHLPIVSVAASFAKLSRVSHAHYVLWRLNFLMNQMSGIQRYVIKNHLMLLKQALTVFSIVWGCRLVSMRHTLIVLVDNM